ncbi:MAG: hypothetical protein IKU48_05975 [Clostridia bacterium]|nr:hypothetical protein [Clostridia bacterium]
MMKHLKRLSALLIAIKRCLLSFSFYPKLKSERRIALLMTDLQETLRQW